MKKRVLAIQDAEPGVQKLTLDIDGLSFGEKQGEDFEKKLLQFLGSDPVHPEIIRRIDNKVVYLTENIIPEKKDERSPVLLLFGNPASHSVASRMFFAFEADRREHRFWRILSEAGILSFSPLPQGGSPWNLYELNQSRKRELLELGYNSPFRIGLAVFYTMPSPANRRPWAGVDGLHRLFGTDALEKIGKYEKERVDGIIGNFGSPNGAVIAFQKDAYQAIKSSESPNYTLAKAKAGHLIGNCHCDPDITLFCLPPTRLLWGYLHLLRELRDRILRASQKLPTQSCQGDYRAQHQ